MSGLAARPLQIVGAGLAGSLLALLLARRGFAVTLYDRRSDPRLVRSGEGRSINLALAARGIRALQRARVMHSIDPLLIAMRGRMLHDRLGQCELQPYGRTAQEVIYSIGRAALNCVLLDEVTRHSQVTVKFEQACTGVDLPRQVLSLRNLATEVRYEIPLATTIATDGAGSAVRASLVAAGAIAVRDEPLEHDYKELTIPARQGAHALARDALHIWPRGGYMLIALPNIGGSFTATLFLPRTGAISFGALDNAPAIQGFCAHEFPDAVALMPDVVHEFLHHPLGELRTVHAMPWHSGAEVLLLGDAAHAIFPFHGQGMNAAFEDCLVLDELLDEHDNWESLFADFERRRRPNAEAIARMSLENYAEMRATVLDPCFKRHQQIALELEERFPERFIRRYSMVMFHPEIPYAEALRRGEVQAHIVAAVDREPARAAALIQAHLPPINSKAR